MNVNTNSENGRVSINTQTLSSTWTTIAYRGDVDDNAVSSAIKEHLGKLNDAAGDGSLYVATNDKSLSWSTSDRTADYHTAELKIEKA